MRKHLLRPDEHPDEDALDNCPICGRDLTDEGECEVHGNENEWRALAAESRASVDNGRTYEE